MSRVDFYILPDGASSDRYACSVAAKAWLQGHTVHMQTTSADKADQMDKLLWTFHDISFVPHEMIDPDSESDTAVTIGNAVSTMPTSQVVINLDADVPENISKYERVVEIVAGNAEQKQLARARYRFYKSNNFELHDHKIDSV